MASNVRAYYEKYWTNEEGEAVEADPLTPRRLAFFGRHVPPGASVLDAGCGSGRTTASLRARGYRAFGIELAIEALRKTVAGKLPAALCAVDAPLPFRDSTFDAIYCAEVLEHLIDPAAAIRELRRVLRPGGRIVASVPYHGLVKNIAVALHGFETHFDPRGQHVRFFTRKTFRRLFDDERLRTLSVKGIGRVWPIYMDMLLLAEKPMP